MRESELVDHVDRPDAPMPHATKEIFLASRVCPTNAWLLRNSEGKRELSAAERLRMDEGREAGAKAREAMPGGVFRVAFGSLAMGQLEASPADRVKRDLSSWHQSVIVHQSNSEVTHAPMVASPKYRFSGHETFPFRYAWLPKAVRAIEKDPRILCDDDLAMVELGVGKNMVRAIRFWATVAGVAENLGQAGWRTTQFGEFLLGSDGGQDQFLEDRQTLWLLHWRISTELHEPLFAWDYLLNKWHAPDFTRASALEVFWKESNRFERPPSKTTLGHHIDTFLHTYVPTSGAKPAVLEEGLDCPLVELELIQKVGDRVSDPNGSRAEPVYAFRREEKPDIEPGLFAYCCLDFAWRRHSGDATISLRELAVGHCSPGQVFKLPEAAVRERLEHISSETDGLLSYDDTNIVQQLRREPNVAPAVLLRRVYEREMLHA